MIMEVLFVSENYMRTNFQISENLQSQFLLPAIRNAQFIKYQAIIGEVMYNRLVEGIKNDDLTDAEKDLLNHSKLFIGYSAMVDLCMMTTAKIDNIGVNITSDDRVQTLQIKDVFQVKDYLQHQADFYCKTLQNFILNNKHQYPEIDQCQCRKIESNLYSSASCGVNLGGQRGKGQYGKFKKYHK